jgi:hypothetical protein
MTTPRYPSLYQINTRVWLTPGWDDNWTNDCFLVFAWQGGAEERHVVAVNYAANQSQCHVRLPFANLGGKKWRLQDQLSH